MILVSLLFPLRAGAQIWIDINAPSIQKIKIAIPDFINSSGNMGASDLSYSLAMHIMDILAPYKTNSVSL